MALPTIISKLSIFIRYEEQLTENGFLLVEPMKKIMIVDLTLETNLCRLAVLIG
jgi:hypothetical protein